MNSVNRPVPFAGTNEQLEANRHSHHWIFDGEIRCMDCDHKAWHVGADYPCGATKRRCGNGLKGRSSQLDTRGRNLLETRDTPEVGERMMYGPTGEVTAPDGTTYTPQFWGDWHQAATVYAAVIDGAVSRDETARVRIDTGPGSHRIALTYRDTERSNA